MNRTALVLVSFAVVFGTLCVVSYTQKSATWDEPQHLTTGILALRQHDYRLDPEHPPFLRLWAALPLTCAARTDTTVIDRITPNEWAGLGQFYFAHKFLYVDNDADRLLYRARFMIVLLGVLLGVLLFAWVREWLGFWPATLTLAFYCLEPNLQAHASLVTTDFGITCFMFGTLYFLWRTCRRLSPSNVAGLTAFFALATVSKYSAVLLGPIVFVLLAFSVWPRRTMKPLAALGIVILLFTASWLAIWAVYGFRYAPSPSEGWLFQFDRDPSIMARAPVATRFVSWVDAHRLLPNTFSQGFLLGQSKAQTRGAFFAGHHSTTGWWYYFPAAFLIKTPVALILLLLGAVVAVVRHWRARWVDVLFIVLPLAVYLATAMTQRLNIGLRHILPVYPFVLLLAALCVAELLRRVPLVLALLAAVWLFEFARVYPNQLAFFNSFVGGPRNGYKYFVDSNLDWGQDLKGLKRWMDAHDLKHIALSYFGTADPAYYGIQCSHLPGTVFYHENSVSAPELPGYVAVSATCLQGAYLSDAGREFYRPLLQQEPKARIGNSIFVYWVEWPWWP